MVRLLRVLMRVMFRAAAVAALVWIGRELMRRWVNGPEEPKVAGGWQTWQPERAATPVGVPAAADAGEPASPAPDGPVAKKAAAPAKKARPKKAAARADAPSSPNPSEPASPVEPATAAAEPTEPRAAGGVPGTESTPAKRRQRPLKAARLPKAEPPTKSSSSAKAARPAKAAQPTKAAPADVPAPAAGAAKRGRKAAEGSWVSPNGTGDAPPSHPVKAKLVSRLYRVPGMPMYARTVPDRCYETPEAAEADGFTRAAR